jgi:hypothetical protein
MSRFQKVTTVYHGEEITLENGDGQYRTLGYEPYIQYVRKYFEDNNYVYNINCTRKSDENDFIEDFMQRKTGYCIHFASAAVMMFRSMGIPARYAEGYFVESSSLTSDANGVYEYVVTDESAHAWVEIYQEGIGWIPVEVTPGYQNFVITKERVTGETKEESTTTEETTTQEKEKNEDTTRATGETTTKEVTTGETTTQSAVLQNKQNLKKHRTVWPVLFLLAVVAIWLFRYQYLCSRNNKRLVEKSKSARMKEIERQLLLTNHIFGIKFQPYDTGEEKAVKLREKLRKSDVTEQEFLRALKILDKYHYAPAGSIEEEEVEELFGFFKKYTAGICRNGKKREKFMYKYIKCLYLSDK